MTHTKPIRLLAFVVACLAARVLSAADTPLNIRLGTILPTGTPQHALLQQLAEDWRNESGGSVKLTLYPDGRLGGESEMVKKIRIKQIGAGLFSAIGLSEIEPSARGLQVMPMMFHSWGEVDYVREHIRPLIESRLQAKGCTVIFWADAGWVHFFSGTPAETPDDYRKLKVFAWAGEPDQLELMRSIGFQPIPLETTDILVSLDTGMINAVPMPPLIALASQINRRAPHMLELDWAPIVGAAVVRTDLWEKIPADLRAKLAASAEQTGEKIRARGRLENDEAVTAMKAHGLQVQSLTPEAAQQWQALTTQIYPRIRGKIVPADVFDAVQQYLREYRAAHGGDHP